jgi:hypothetical protein
MKNIRLFFVFVTLISASSSGFADEQRRTALGFTFDFLPTVLSAATGNAGYSYQTWIGVDHLRVRLVGAQIYMPDALASSRNFDHHSMTVAAGIIDYVFGDHFDGAWVGSGVELWQNRLRSRDDGVTHYWLNQVLTLGGGYIFRVAGNFYVEPWGAVHCIMNNRTISSASGTFLPKRFSAEVSLKAGYFFDM